MFFSISILLVFVSRTLQQTTIPAMAASYPYRIGQKSLLASDLATNGTYLVTFDIQYPSSTELMPPLLAIPNMDFLNTASNQIFFSIDPYNFNSNDNIKFSFEVKLGPLNTYYTKIRIKYFVAIINDNVLLPMYIYTNEKTLIQSDTVNQLKVYEQELFYNPPCVPIPIIGCVLSLLNNITSTLGLPLTSGLGGSLNNDSSSPYTVIEVKTFITKLDLTYNGPWSFSAQSKSTNISNLNFQVKMSNSITGTPKYNFSVLVRNTSYSLATASYKFNSGTFDTASDSFWSKQQGLVSHYFLLGFTSIAMGSSNTNKKINFLLQSTTSELLLYTTTVTANTHTFPAFAFMFIKCTNTSYQNLMFENQECYSTCPTTYYSNASKFCAKCISPCKTCTAAAYCITCLPSLKLVPSSGSCVPCSSGYYFDDTLLNCQPCLTGCTSCDNLTYCTNCSVPMKLILSSNQCISCQSTQYFKYNSGSGTSSCESCPTGCTTCDNSSYCTNCSVPMKLVLSSNQCVSCLNNEYFKYDTGTGISACQPCPTGCTSCDNSTHCTNCSVPMKLILSAYQCVSCLSTQYFQFNSGLGTSSCELCPFGCKTCLSSTSCLSCYVSMKLVLAGSLCVSCSTSEYFLYDSLSDTSSCQNCPTGCTTCDNTTYCLTCSVLMQLVLINNECVQCAAYKYFYYDPVLQTSTCQNCPHGCNTCDNSSHCFTCNSSLEYYYENDYCYHCNQISKYFNSFTQKCEVCSEGCLHCNSLSNCTQCDWNHEYQMKQSQCYQCVPPTIFTRAMKCEYLYQQEVSLNQEISILRICSKFNISQHDVTNTEKLIQDYYISLFIDNDQKQYFNLTIDSNEKLICFDYQIVSSFTNQQIDVIYHNKTNTDRIINPQFVNHVNGSKIYTFQKDIYDFLQNVMDVMSSGSGISAPILFLSSGISFLMGFIQFAEITSLYIFTQAPIPYNFKKFLQTIIEAQNFPLLPFSIPNPIESDQLKVVEKQVFSEYDIDQYFIRGNFINLMEIMVYISLYLVLCFLFHFVKSKNIFARFFYKQFVARCYSNCALALEVVQIMLIFSASVAVSSRGYLNPRLIMNSVTGLLFTLVLLGCAMVNIVYLYKFKTVRTVDTEEIYPALERNRKGAEMYTFLRTLCLLSVALLIPLIHYVYIVLMVIGFLSGQLWYLFNKNVHKFRIQNWIRILHTFIFLLFNVLFLIYFIIDRYFPQTDTDLVLRIGNVSMISLLAIYSCDLLFALIDIGDKIYQKLANVICKKKVIEDRIQQRNAMFARNRIPEEKQITLAQVETQDKSNVDSAKLMLNRARRVKPVSRQKVQFKRMKRFSRQSKVNNLDLSDFNTKPNSNSPLNNNESQFTIQDPNDRQAGIKSQRMRHRKNNPSYKKRTSLVDKRKQGEVIRQQINLQSEQVMFPTTDRKERTVRSRMFKNTSK